MKNENLAVVAQEREQSKGDRIVCKASKGSETRAGSWLLDKRVNREVVPKARRGGGGREQESWVGSLSPRQTSFLCPGTSFS